MVCAPCLLPYAASTAGAFYAVKTIDKNMTKKKKSKKKKSKKVKKGGRTRRILKGGRTRIKKTLKGGQRKKDKAIKKNILHDYLMNGGNINDLLVEHI